MRSSRLLEKLIHQFQLKPHPEGGYFKETYRSKGTFLWKGRPRKRNFSTAILFLLPKGSRSRLHRIRSDEVWHFHMGGPLTIVEFEENGRILRTVLGNDLPKGHVLQHVVPAGRWFGAYPHRRTEFSLVGCTVAPGFEFDDLKMGNRTKLLKLFPRWRKDILKLTS